MFQKVLSENGNLNNPAPLVAIDKDKNSQHAFKWAIDNLLLSESNLTLIHVKNENCSEADVQLVFTPFRAYCARKAITMQEIVLEDMDVSKALIDYINENYITNIVLGASSWNPLVRKFWSTDIPTMINKAAPDHCSVYVIAKGKTQSARPAASPMIISAPSPPLRTISALETTMSRINFAESETISRAMSLKGEHIPMGSERIKPKKGLDSKTSKIMLSQKYISDDNNNEFLSPPKSEFIDVPGDNNIVDNAGEGNTPSKDMEAEMKRLKLELKQTMDMYNSACKEAVSATLKAKELNDWKLEEAIKFEQARLAEEAALRIAEMETAKCKAAMEAAEKAQKIAEMEGQRRRYAEQKAKRESKEKNKALSVLSNQDVRYRRYTTKEIETATENFDMSLKIGEGGYGPVFGAKLDHTPVAIKVLSPDAAQGQQQFQQEVEVLSSMRHPNMVILLGACPEYGCLVYEYMNNGSLEDRLFRKDNTPPLPWGVRFRIASEIATALLFLHQAKPEPLVHRDLKPANILLDKNYVSKISDVGLARLVPASVADSVTQYHMTSAAGTFCYIDPEYQQTGKLGTKSDIYSLGIMLLQIITARPPMGLTYHVERAIEKGTFHDLLDPTVSDWPVEDALGFAKLALNCAELRKKDRPDLGKVILPELNRLNELGMSSSSSRNFRF